jgi:RNA polymerase sigma-70 factor (ECF subfamily)
MVQVSTNPTANRVEEQQLLHCLAAGETRAFWQLFQKYRGYLLRCCLKWTNGNSTDAEDALSQAMLKAWEKVQKYATGEITNFKGWLTTLTRNLCVDMYRERSRGANKVEDIEAYARSEEQGLVSSDETPENALEADEKKIVIRRAIDSLPARLRETFILHFYKELSHQEIAQQQDISYQNVCKRISQARKILQEDLRGYFIGKEGADTDKAVPLTATESAIGELSEGNVRVEAGAAETVTLSVAVEEVESVGDEDAIEVARDVQHSESVMVVATNDEKLELKSDGCRCVEAVPGERQSAPILARAQFEEETGSWGNSCVLVQRRLEQHDQEEWEGNSATVPHSLFLSSFQFSIPSQESVGDGNERKLFLTQTSSKLFYSKGNFIEKFQKVSKKTSREIKVKRNELDFPLVRNPNLVIEAGGNIQAEKISSLEDSESDRVSQLRHKKRFFLYPPVPQLPNIIM